jgi:hypothetical protein
MPPSAERLFLLRGERGGKVLKLLLVHDLAESDPAVGDITPFDGW